MKFSIFFCISIFFYNSVYTQKQDYNWMIGGACETFNDDFTLKVINFNKSFIRSNPIDKTFFNLGMMNVGISDEEGNLLFYSNGNDIVNWQHEVMDNGADLLGDENCFARLIPQALLALPYPGDLDKYILFYLIGEFNVGVTNIFYSVIDMSLNNGEGKVVVKDEVLINDVLAHGSITAVKSANGRDWWLLMFKADSQNYYRVPINSDGIGDIELLSSSIEVRLGFSSANYSPDGSKFGIISNLSMITGGEFYLCDVNRCDGLLENCQTFTFGPQPSSPVGIAFSPDSRFLYTAIRDSLYQYDLQVPIFLDSKTFISSSNGIDENGDEFLSTVFLMQEAPNGKIYVASSIDNQYLHVIHNPNEKGQDCNFELRGLDLSSSLNFSLPNNPNFRLGPIDGSICDTLGIDNNPVAKFNFEETNTVDYAFRDLSYFEPREWFWDFGDGTGSSEQNPSHQFLDFGDYQVCLTVSNENSSDTYCEDICVHPNANFIAYLEARNNILDCNNGTNILALNATIDGVPAEEFEHLRIEWEGPNGLSAVDETQIQISEGGNYVLSIMDTLIGCESIDSIFIHENFYPPTFTYSLSAPTLSCGATLDIILGVDSFSFSTVWRDEQFGILSGTATTLQVHEAGQYSATVINAETGCGTTAFIQVENEEITAAWTAEEMGAIFSFNPTLTNTVDHSWDFGDGFTSVEMNPVHTYASGGTYEVTHIVRNACGADTLVQPVEVVITSSYSIEKIGLEVYPNPASDVLNIHSKEREIASLSLYSSVGQKVIDENPQTRLAKFSVDGFTPRVYWLHVVLLDGSEYWTKIVVVE